MAEIELEAATREAIVTTLEPERPAATTLLEEVSERVVSASSRTRTTAKVVWVVAVIEPSTEHTQDPVVILLLAQLEQPLCFAQSCVDLTQSQ